MLLQWERRNVSLVGTLSCHTTPSGSSIDAVGVPAGDGGLGVWFCRGSAASRLVVGDSVWSQPTLLQIAGRFSQYSDSLLDTQSEHQLPNPGASPRHPPTIYPAH